MCEWLIATKRRINIWVKDVIVGGGVAVLISEIISRKGIPGLEVYRFYKLDIFNVRYILKRSLKKFGLPKSLSLHTYFLNLVPSAL